MEAKINRDRTNQFMLPDAEPELSTAETTTSM